MNMPQRTATAASIAVRQAAEYDLVERLRLRSLLFDDLAGDFFNPATGDGSWLDALAVVLKQQLTVDDVRILVVDADGGGDGDNEGGGLAACGIGSIEQRLPGPHLLNGRIGQVIGVVTDPAHRRRGYGRAVMRGLLYRDLGFTDHPDLT
ncbi:GNAT family N-acetyltransferase [Streptomyces sp. KC 17012]|nr:GNAT family N-acetyltransferase [Streptomyces plumbidurans]